MQSMNQYKLSTYQALELVTVLDNRLKKADLKSFRNLGVDFSGYYDRMSGRMTSGCTKVECITSIVNYLMDKSFGPSPKDVAEWLDEKVPGWQKEIGYKADE